MKLSILTALISFLSTTALAGTNVYSAKFTYERNYDSDSGWADINECVRNEFSSGGKYVGNTIVHDWVSNPSETNVFCAGLGRSEQSSIVYFLSKNETECDAYFATGKVQSVNLFWCGR